MTNLDKYNQRVVNIINIIKYALENNVACRQACIQLGFPTFYIKDFNRRHNPNNIDPALYKAYLEINEIYSERKINGDILVKVESKNLNIDEKFDSRSTCGENRDEHGKILNYWYKILVRDEEPFTGILTREQMDTIYQNYSYVTTNSCSSFFPYLTFVQFKRILRVFNITKEKLWPVHRLEEHTEEELAIFALKAKEHASYKKFVEQKPIFIEQEFKKVQRELFDLKEDRDWVKDVIDEYFTNRVNNPSDIITKIAYDHVPHENNKDKKTLFAILGDIHFGKKFNKTVYGRGSDKLILKERMMKIAESIDNEIRKNQYGKIQILCMGDLIESILPEGMHPSHVFEMDLYGSEQVMYAINVFEEFFFYLLKATPLQIDFIGLGGNHDRIGIKREEDKKRSAAKIIYGVLEKLFNQENSGINISNPEDEIISLLEDGLSIIGHHGDANIMKRKPLDIINLFKKGSSETFNVLLNGHWHSTKVEEGINYVHIGVPSVCSTDNFIQYELGVGSQPGFLLGHKAHGFGFDFKKITLY